MKAISHSVLETLNIGKLIAANAQPGDIICLLGQLGSGKTVFTKGIAAGLGIGPYKIVSPSFVLIRQYESARIPLYHFDLYRLKDPQDILILGYEEYLYGRGLSVIEWADRLDGLMPQECLRIEFAAGKLPGERLLKLLASGLRYKELLSRVIK